CAHRHVDRLAVEGGGTRAAGGTRAGLETERLDGCRRSEAGDAQRADLDRRTRLAAHAVEPVVCVLEAVEHVRERPRELDLDLPALPAVAKVGASDPLGAFERGRQPGLELV